MSFKQYLDIKADVREALLSGQPVVAMESGIVAAQSSPAGRGLEMAHRAQEIIREEGAVPAMIAILDGRVRVGLEDEELERITQDPKSIKTSRRDLPTVVATHRTGVTTVSATAYLAVMAGIPVMVTSGIGGVRRGASHTFDISADLFQLSRTPAAVVCSGVDSSQDSALTLEYLETLGVPVIGVGTDYFPDFYTPSSGCQVSCRFDDMDSLANMIQVKQNLRMDGGLLIANPIPQEYALDKDVIEPAVAKAMEEARERGLRGKLLTPFLLERLAELTEGATVEARLQILYSNARVGARLAAQVARLSR